MVGWWALVVVADPVVALIAVDCLVDGSPGPPLGQVVGRLGAKGRSGSLSWLLSR
jgi:hypothetical protein